MGPEGIRIAIGIALGTQKGSHKNQKVNDNTFVEHKSIGSLHSAKF